MKHNNCLAGLRTEPSPCPFCSSLISIFCWKKWLQNVSWKKNVTRVEDAAVFPTDENEDLEKLDLSWGSGHHHNLITPTLLDMITKENWKEVIPLL